ncbi:unnamed protein product [Staurois parvus]|uniref:Uncharacterized protein n=1 Tax=Staurois parvus TaxID=386267 RepID=A0ABN9GE18_9NEOB|nr:unnamed protein product [Staurois parvus]
MVRDCRHETGKGQRLHTGYRRWSETAEGTQEMVRDCRQDTRDIRDCRQEDTGDGQRLQTGGYKRWS